MNAFLFRRKYKTHTYGTLVVDGELFHTIERPWLDNRSNISCIPTGNYSVNFLLKSGSGKYREVWHVLAVPGRGGILIHNGNLASHSKGCLILGSRKGTLGGKPAVLGSRPALRKLQKIVGRAPFNLTIMGESHA
jgi:hypothetical protein